MSIDSDTLRGDHDGAIPPQGPANEKFRVRGEMMAEKVKELVHEANVRRITVKDSAGRTVIEIPVTAGVVAAVVAPMLIAVAALAAVASDWEIEVHRAGEREAAAPPTTPNDQSA